MLVRSRTCCGPAAVCLVVLVAGCGVDNGSHVDADPAGGEAAPSSFKTEGAVSIASFNIQVFGVSKEDKPEVMDVLARAVRMFDVVAIQEIRAKDQGVLPRFIERINADGSRYDYAIGPRLGRTSSKEQYAFVFDTMRIEIAPDSVETLGDPQDYLHREPLIARFRVRGPPPERAFTFRLVNVHTDPDEVDLELDALPDAFSAIRRFDDEDDVILLGDLNADPYHFGRLGKLPNIGWAITDLPTNTRKTETYDNLVFDTKATIEYLGRSGVLDLEETFGLTREQALEVSDHLPVWGIFGAEEGVSGPLASRK